MIGELKLSFTLDLVLQAVDWTAACDQIWLAVRTSRRGRGREHDPRVRKLCRLLGLGLGLLVLVIASLSMATQWTVARSRSFCQ